MPYGKLAYPKPKFTHSFFIMEHRETVGPPALK